MKIESTSAPLIMRFASRLSEKRAEVYRYNPERQVSQVWDGFCWIDTIHARRTVASETSMTKVHQETTDDC